MPLQPRNGWTEEAAAGGEHQSIVGQDPAAVVRAHDFDGASRCIYGVDDAPDVADVNRSQNVSERGRHCLWVRLIKAWADYQLRFGCHKCDLKIADRGATGIAQAGGRKRRVHAGKSGTNDDQSLYHAPVSVALNELQQPTGWWRTRRRRYIVRTISPSSPIVGKSQASGRSHQMNRGAPHGRLNRSPMPRG